jgi:hypothetical protein
MSCLKAPVKRWWHAVLVWWQSQWLLVLCLYTQVCHIVVIVMSKIYLARSEFLTVLLLIIHVFWDAILFCWVSGYQHFEGSQCLQNTRNHSLNDAFKETWSLNNVSHSSSSVTNKMANKLYPDHCCIFTNVSHCVENNPTKPEVVEQF